MKSFLIVCLSFIPVLSQAQKAKKETVKAPTFVGGVQASIFNSMQQSNTGAPLDLDMINVGPGIFLRYYLGDHFALETGFNYQVSEKEFREFQLYTTPGVGWIKRSMRSKSFSLPLNVQYHFLPRETPLRPYVGIGGGYTSYTHDIEDHQQDKSLAIDEITNRTEKDNSGFLQFAQGLTYQVNNRLQINEVLFYQYEMNQGRQNVGIRVGVAYTLQ